MAKTKIEYIERLIAMLVEKTGETPDHAGFGYMSEKIGDGISQRYLYDKLQKRIDKAKEVEEEYVQLSLFKLDKIARFLGFKSFKDFQKSCDEPINTVLKSCIGTWISYVRRNSEHNVLYASPVLVYEENQKIWFHLKGPTWAYNGLLKYRNGCLFSLFEANGGKQFHHVYKIGNREDPQVLQGVFSGVSTANEPIAGRAVLIKQEKEFTSLENQALRLSEVLSSTSLVLRRLAEYFSNHQVNNLGISQVTTFDIDDLGKCE